MFGLGLTEDDVVCCAAPVPPTSRGRCARARDAAAVGDLVVLPGSTRPRRSPRWPASRDVLCGVPTMLVAMLSCAATRPTCPTCGVATARIDGRSEALIEPFETVFGIESSTAMGSPKRPPPCRRRRRPAEVKATTIGRANPHLGRSSIRRPGVPRPTGRSESCACAATHDERLLGERDARGVRRSMRRTLHTGDLAARHGSGIVTLHGRLRDGSSVAARTSIRPR